MPSRRSARANDIWAVGETAGGSSALDGSTLIEHFNGSDWNIVPSPTPGAVPMLTGVAGRSATDVFAVGTNQPSMTGGSEHVMILRWNGRSWTVKAPPTAASVNL